MRNHLDAAPCERRFDITLEKPLRFLLSPQYCIHVAERQSLRKCVCLFP